MMREFKIKFIDRCSLMYSDNDVEFTMGGDGAFEMTEPGKPPNLIGFTIYEYDMNFIRGHLSVEKFEIERIKQWLINEGFPKVFSFNPLNESDSD